MYFFKILPGRSGIQNFTRRVSTSFPSLSDFSRCFNVERQKRRGTIVREREPVSYAVRIFPQSRLRAKKAVRRRVRGIKYVITRSPLRIVWKYTAMAICTAQRRRTNPFYPRARDKLVALVNTSLAFQCFMRWSIWKTLPDVLNAR